MELLSLWTINFLKELSRKTKRFQFLLRCPAKSSEFNAFWNLKTLKWLQMFVVLDLMFLKWNRRYKLVYFMEELGNIFFSSLFCVLYSKVRENEVSDRLSIWIINLSRTTISFVFFVLIFCSIKFCQYLCLKETFVFFISVGTDFSPLRRWVLYFNTLSGVYDEYNPPLLLISY